jgi:hypothetical protein
MILKKRGDCMRKLTMKRKKSIVASIMKVYLYVEVKGEGEIELNHKPCKKLATIKNGKEAVVDIPEDAVSIFIVFDKHFPNRFKDEYQLEAGQDDVKLYTKPKLNPLKGNPFKIFKME